MGKSRGLVAFFQGTRSRDTSTLQVMGMNQSTDKALVEVQDQRPAGAPAPPASTSPSRLLRP